MQESFRFHHIGIAVKSMDKTAREYERVGYDRTETTFDAMRHVNICFLTKEGMPTIELIEPVDENAPVGTVLGKNGAVIYHTCYAVEDIVSVIEKLREQRYVQVEEVAEAPAMHGCKICFLFHKDVGLIELVEEQGY